MTIQPNNNGVIITGSKESARYDGIALVFDSETVIAHESRGGALTSVWAGDLGEGYIEVVHFGDGPLGGELIVTIPGEDTVLIGGLYTPRTPADVPESWPPVIDLALGLMRSSTRIITTSGAIDKDELEAFHQRLLGVIHG